MMTNAVKWLVLGLFCAQITACRSSEKKEKEPEPAAAVKAEPVKDQTGQVKATPPSPEGKSASEAAPCAARPEPVVCCEALTPACNECRARSAKQMAEWTARCEKPAVADKGCAGNPPVVACCGDATAACRTCREKAMAELLAWRGRCGDSAAHPCERQPPQAECCAGPTPACDACRERNRRVKEEWTRRCQ